MIPQPKDLNEAIEILTETVKRDAKAGGPVKLEDIAAIPEEKYVTAIHHNTGRAMRNAWGLWWSEKSLTPKPPIVQFFTDLGIYHADDMSGIITTSFHRTLRGVPVDLEGQVQECKKHWIEQGFPDRIPK